MQPNRLFVLNGFFSFEQHQPFLIRKRYDMVGRRQNGMIHGFKFA